jgi:hypothetical protein
MILGSQLIGWLRRLEKGNGEAVQYNAYCFVGERDDGLHLLLYAGVRLNARG